MRWFISILISTGAALVVAQAAVAQFTPVPITVTSQTLRVYAFGSDTGLVPGGSSLVVPFNFGAEEGSTAGTVSSVLTDGELIVTVNGALSNGGIWDTAHLAYTVKFFLEITAPDLGAPMTPLYFQIERVSSDLTGAAETGGIDTTSGNYNVESQLLGGLVNLGYVWGYLEPEDTRISSYVLAIPGDTITFNVWGQPWALDHYIRVPVMNATGVFTEVIVVRAFTPLPEPASSLTIPSGAAMLLALAKLRGAGLGR